MNILHSEALVAVALLSAAHNVEAEVLEIAHAIIRGFLSAALATDARSLPLWVTA